MDDIFESILNSVKKMLGLMPEYTEFDADIVMNINAALSTLRQLGVGPSNPFLIKGAEETYADYLGEDCKETSYVKMYLYYKTKLGFDPPQSSLVAESIKEMINETEWRMMQNVNLTELSKDEEEKEPDTEDPSGGEIEDAGQ